MTRTLFIAVFSYLLGSIPFGYLLVRIFRGEDVRQSGSGNIGATNVFRKSPFLGGLTLALDALKGAAAVEFARRAGGPLPDGRNLCRLMAMAAFCAVAGHIFPLWLKFKGGKGVATALGSFIVLAPKAILLSALIFLVTVLLFRYVSLGSIVAVALFPLFALRPAFARGTQQTFAFIAATSMLIILRHHENIRRLYTGTEPRIGAKLT
jgi:acyl phosphate:glycerol-3-phosphate acyltransferase